MQLQCDINCLWKVYVQIINYCIITPFKKQFAMHLKILWHIKLEGYLYHSVQYPYSACCLKTQITEHIQKC
jgi:hypothetical protein